MQPALFYADDSILFFEPCVQQVGFLKMILLAFQHVSGLALNRAKSNLVVIAGSDELATSLAREMGCRVAQTPLNYLGLPLSEKKLRRHDYYPLIERIRKKLTTWTAAIFSPAGRLVLVNACISAMPLYFMSAFELPKWVIKEIDKIRMRFYWHGANDSTKRLIMVPWNTICTPKKQGGLGVLYLGDMNKALLAKWLWHWTANKDRPWVLIAARMQNNGITRVPLHSPLKSAFQEIAPALITAITATPNDEEDILFWGHNWGLGVLQFSHSELFSFAVNKDISLANFFRKWRQGEELFLPTLASSSTASRQWLSISTAIEGYRLSTPENRDFFKWNRNNDGRYSVKSFYTFLKSFPRVDSNLQNVWNLRIPPRMKIFIWQMAQNKIATIDNLKKRGWHLANICHLCFSEEESVRHLFNDCSCYTETLARLRRRSAILRTSSIHNLPDLFLLPTMDKRQQDLIAILCFVLWRERCARIFRGCRSTYNLLVDQVFLDWAQTSLSTEGTPLP